MKKIIFALLLAMILGPVGANAAMFVKYDGVDGESTDSSADGTEASARIDADTQEASVPGVEPEEIDNSATGSTSGSTGIGDLDGDGDLDTTSSASGGNAETTWKVEEGEKTPGIEPDEIDAPAMEGDAEITLKAQGDEGMESDGLEPDEIDAAMRQHTNFALLLSGGTEENKSKGTVEATRKVEEGTANTVPGVEPDEIDLAADGEEAAIMEEQSHRMDADTILNAVQETTDWPIEIVQLNHEEEELEATVRHTVKLFGFIPVTTRAIVIIDSKENIEVKFPWWTFLASGKNKEGLGSGVFGAILSVL